MMDIKDSEITYYKRIFFLSNSNKILSERAQVRRVAVTWFHRLEAGYQVVLTVMKTAMNLDLNMVKKHKLRTFPVRFHLPTQELIRLILMLRI